MMKKIVLLFATFGFVQGALSQSFELFEGDNGNDIWMQVNSTMNGGWVMCGSFDHEITEEDAWVLKTDADGSVEWSITFESPEEQILYDVFELPNGDLIAGGTSRQPGGGYVYDALFCRISDQGEIIDQVTLSTPNSVFVRSLMPVSDEEFFAVGWQETETDGNEIILYRLDQDLNVVSESAYGLGDSRGVDIISDGQSGWYVAGIDLLGGNEMASWIVYHIDEDLNVILSLEYPFTTLASVHSMYLDGNGFLIVSGVDKDANNDWRAGIARIPLDFSDVSWLSTGLGNSMSAGVFAPNDWEVGVLAGYGEHPETGQFLPFQYVFNADLQWENDVEWLDLDEGQCIVRNIAVSENKVAWVGHVYVVYPDNQGWLRVVDIPSTLEEAVMHQYQSLPYPNPTQGEITLLLKPGDTVDWFCSSGAKVTAAVVSKGNGRFNLSHLAPGLYRAQVQSGNGLTVYHRVVVQY